MVTPVVMTSNLQRVAAIVAIGRPVIAGRMIMRVWEGRGD